MWIVSLALRRPYTFIVLALVIMLLGVFTILRTPTDIFPNIKIPVVAVVWNYTGLSPERDGNRIVAAVRAQRADDHGQRRRAHRVAVAQRHRGRQVLLPAGRQRGPGRARRSPASRRPCCAHAAARHAAAVHPRLQRLERADPAAGPVQRQAVRRRRSSISATTSSAPQLATVPGASMPYPYGGKQRQVQIDLRPRRAARPGPLAVRRQQCDRAPRT